MTEHNGNFTSLKSRMQEFERRYQEFKQNIPVFVDYELTQLSRDIIAIPDEASKIVYLDLHRAFKRRLAEQDAGEIMGLESYLDVTKAYKGKERLHLRVNADFVDFKVSWCFKNLTMRLKEGATEQKFWLPSSGTIRKLRELKPFYKNTLTELVGEKIVLLVEFANGYHFTEGIQTEKGIIKF